ncbi:MAG: ATP-dependent DNA helicase RecG [Bacillota bacterium]|nr:ATP-dependent DNA helicase RecG [Bacillota bacterium]
MELALNDSIRFIKGVGETRLKLWEKAGVLTVNDLITYYPRSYEDHTVVKNLSDIVPYESCSVIASVVTPPVVNRIRKGMELLKFRIGDGTGYCDVTFFNQIYLKNSFEKGKTYLFYGRFEGDILRHSLTNPFFDSIASAGIDGSIVPIYPLTKGLSEKIITKTIDEAVKLCIDKVQDPIPNDLRIKLELSDLKSSIKSIHKPESFAELELAKKRLIFDEFLTLQLGLFMIKNRKTAENNFVCNKSADEFVASLPYSLTQAQRKSIDECLNDIKSNTSLNRLIQGDVGSGKTVVAAAVAYAIATSGGQCVFMAPTSILAVQHAETLKKMMADTGLSVSLIIGSMSKANRSEALSKIASGEINIIVGTHALLEQDVIFKKLALIVCDEQHRFGVAQRARLTLKGDNPHLLAMSATPIPRTLALMIYGDLDISVINELPPGRKPVITHLVNSKKRDTIDKFIAQKLSQGLQGYIVCPLVDDNESADGLNNVKDYTKNLKMTFPTASIEFMHGRMKAVEKEQIMQSFLKGEIQILVSTTVIEVGVDAPNAVFIIIENAERFGLSQLHQLRGRVGRGNNKSYCIMVTDSNNPDTLERLKVIASTNDGFLIAQKDLELRGPGDFFGKNQHGLPNLKIADIASDTRILKLAQDTAKSIISEDPELRKSDYALFKNNMIKLFEMQKGNFLN